MGLTLTLIMGCLEGAPFGLLKPAEFTSSSWSLSTRCTKTQVSASMPNVHALLLSSFHATPLDNSTDMWTWKPTILFHLGILTLD